MKFYSFKQTDEQKVELYIFGDVMTLIWCHSDEY